MQRNLLTAVALGAALSAQAHYIHYYAPLSGAAEATPNASPGSGIVWVNYDPHTSRLQIMATFSNLQGTVTMAHIHAPTTVALSGTANVATTTPTFPGFPSGLTSGSYSNTLDLTQASSFSAAYLAANGGTPATAEAALAAAFNEGKAYFNLHTTSYGGGEVRGFILPVPISEPRIFLFELLPPNFVLVHFDTEANRAYTLEYSDHLPAQGPWQPLYVVPSQPFNSHYAVPDGRTNTHRFYRLKVVP
jgi:hypothetical protein